VLLSIFPQRNKGKYCLNVLLQLLIFCLYIRNAILRACGHVSFHFRKQMGYFGCRQQKFRKAEGLRKPTPVKNQIWRNVHREARTKVLICKRAITNRHNKTQEQTLLHSLFCTQNKSRKFRHSDGLYRKDLNCIISYNYADFEGILA